VSGSPEPPVLLDGQISLAKLQIYALLFDELSQGQPYTACDFLAWLSLNVKLERRAPGYNMPAGRPGQMRMSAA